MGRTKGQALSEGVLEAGNGRVGDRQGQLGNRDRPLGVVEPIVLRDPVDREDAERLVVEDDVRSSEQLLTLAHGVVDRDQLVARGQEVAVDREPVDLVVVRDDEDARILRVHDELRNVHALGGIHQVVADVDAVALTVERDHLVLARDGEKGLDAGLHLAEVLRDLPVGQNVERANACLEDITVARGDCDVVHPAGQCDLDIGSVHQAVVLGVDDEHLILVNQVADQPTGNERRAGPPTQMPVFGNLDVRRNGRGDGKRHDVAERKGVDVGAGKHEASHHVAVSDPLHHHELESERQPLGQRERGLLGLVLVAVELHVHVAVAQPELSREGDGSEPTKHLRRIVVDVVDEVDQVDGILHSCPQSFSVCSDSL